MASDLLLDGIDEEMMVEFSNSDFDAGAAIMPNISTEERFFIFEKAATYLYSHWGNALWVWRAM